MAWQNQHPPSSQDQQSPIQLDQFSTFQSAPNRNIRKCFDVSLNRFRNLQDQFQQVVGKGQYKLLTDENFNFLNSVSTHRDAFIPVFGPELTGKSSLINNILNTNALPVGDDHLTSRTCIISYTSEAPCIQLRTLDQIVSGNNESIVSYPFNSLDELMQHADKLLKRPDDWKSNQIDPSFTSQPSHLAKIIYNQLNFNELESKPESDKDQQNKAHLENNEEETIPRTVDESKLTPFEKLQLDHLSSIVHIKYPFYSLKFGISIVDLPGVSSSDSLAVQYSILRFFETIKPNGLLFCYKNATFDASEMEAYSVLMQLINASNILPPKVFFVNTFASTTAFTPSSTSNASNNQNNANSPSDYLQDDYENRFQNLKHRNLSIPQSTLGETYRDSYSSFACIDTKEWRICQVQPFLMMCPRNEGTDNSTRQPSSSSSNTSKGEEVSINGKNSHVDNNGKTSSSLNARKIAISRVLDFAKRFVSFVTLLQSERYLKAFQIMDESSWSFHDCVSFIVASQQSVLQSFEPVDLLFSNFCTRLKQCVDSRLSNLVESIKSSTENETNNSMAAAHVQHVSFESDYFENESISSCLNEATKEFIGKLSPWIFNTFIDPHILVCKAGLKSDIQQCIRSLYDVPGDYADQIELGIRQALIPINAALNSSELVHLSQTGKAGGLSQALVDGIASTGFWSPLVFAVSSPVLSIAAVATVASGYASSVANQFRTIGNEWRKSMVSVILKAVRKHLSWNSVQSRASHISFSLIESFRYEFERQKELRRAMRYQFLNQQAQLETLQTEFSKLEAMCWLSQQAICGILDAPIYESGNSGINYNRDFLSNGMTGSVSKGTWRGSKVAIKTPNRNIDYQNQITWSFFEEIHWNRMIIRELLGGARSAKTELARFVIPAFCAYHPSDDFEDDLAWSISYPRFHGDLGTFVAWKTQSILKDAKASLTKHQAGCILLQCWCAIEAIHSIGLIHRDVKLQNYLFFEKEPNGEIMICITDFGLCTNCPKPSDDWGTPEYKAPETATGNYNNKIDVYSFGVTMDKILVLLPDSNSTIKSTDSWTQVLSRCKSQSPSLRPHAEIRDAICQAFGLGTQNGSHQCSSCFIQANH